MDTAKKIQSQASSAKRASTTIDNLLQHIQLQQRNDEVSDFLSGKDRETLIKASSILSRISRRISENARKAKFEEEHFERELEFKSREAKKIISSWPANTVLEKVAIILGSDCGNAFRKEMDPTYFSYWFQEAIRTIPSQAAWMAYTNNTTVDVILADARTRLNVIHENPETKHLAERWNTILGGLNYDN